MFVSNSLVTKCLDILFYIDIHAILCEHLNVTVLLFIMTANVLPMPYIT